MTDIFATLGSIAIARRTNRLKDLSNSKPDNGIFPGIQHFPEANAERAPVSLPFYDHGALLESIYDQPKKPLLSASPEDLRMNLGFRRGNGSGLVAKNGMSGVGATSLQAWLNDVQQWPSDRTSGLTYGEIATLNAWLRDYGVPGLVNATLSGGGGVQDTRNARGESARDAVNRIWTAWKNVTISNRDQLQQALRMHLTMYGFDTGKAQSPYWLGFDIRWPLSRTGQSGIQSKINGMGRDAWLRYVAVMAIGRDLFAEELMQVGGIQPGLQDTLADTQLSGDAVSGEWQNLAGVWRWKGYDLIGRPLNESQPLFAKPAVAPAEYEAAKARNTAFFMKFFSYPTVSASVGPTLTSKVPALLETYRRVIGPRRNASPIADVPRTVQGYAALWAALVNVVGLDLKALLGPSYDAAMAALSTAPAVCPSNYDPVVGRDGKTYSNACVAEQAGQLPPLTATQLAGTAGVGSLLPDGPWRDTALKIAKGAEAVLEGSMNKAAQGEAQNAPAPAPAPAPQYAPQYAPVQSNNGLLAAAAVMGALMLL